MISALLYLFASMLVFCLAFLLIAAVVFYRAPGQYFDADGVRLFYRVEGSGTPVVLIHGYGVNADLNWRLPGVVRALRKRYQVIVFDVRGHGRSDKPHDPAQYGSETARDACRLLDHLGIEKAHVVGYSMGGFITIKLIAMFPDRLLSAVPCGAGWEKPEGEKLHLLAALTDSIDRQKSYAPLIRALEPTPPPAWKVHLASFFLHILNDNTAMSAVMKNFTDLAVTEEELRNNQAPVLSIVGTRDPLGSGVKPMTEIIAHHEAAYIEGGDHMTTMIKGAYLQHLTAFLARHSPETRTPPSAGDMR